MIDKIKIYLCIATIFIFKNYFFTDDSFVNTGANLPTFGLYKYFISMNDLYKGYHFNSDFLGKIIYYEILKLQEQIKVVTGLLKQSKTVETFTLPEDIPVKFPLKGNYELQLLLII